MRDSKFGFVFVDSRVSCRSASSGRMSINFWTLNAVGKTQPSCSSYFLTNSSSSWTRSETSATVLALPMDSALRNKCEVGGIVQGDEGPICGVAQVFCHGVIVVVGHQEEGQEEEVEKQGEVEGEEHNSRNTAHGWHADGMKSANGLEPCGV